ncbi:hypothetical protein FIV42_02670 [Persicimonas caeni]|uniref:Lipoprotein n=1 Tax=Persicimonas caeni TaxID=2292766 RepID=A0A4Y6PN64_PERCE|nr:hypothetical protein [Persicimonas caeni]QDG49680.1 hypothetical protein FIV42_02670 [Persicimonas caeni]QED30901.1 hypothetical protein FRD00_02665 [Persicimonas caeni]
MLSPKSGLFALFIATGSLLLASGCGVDRFNDAGCVSDEECRFSRICFEGTCVDPSGVDQPVEPDAGPDADADVDDPEPDTPTELNFMGQWETNATGQVTQPDGRVEEVDEDRVIVDIREGIDSDLTIRMLDAEGFCPLQARILDANSFELLDVGCISDQGDFIMTYEDVIGRGQVNQEGIFNMTLQATVVGEMEGQPAFNAYLDIAFIEGERR